MGSRQFSPATLMSKPMGRTTSGNDNRCQVITGKAINTDDGSEVIQQLYMREALIIDTKETSEQFDSLLLCPLDGH